MPASMSGLNSSAPSTSAVLRSTSAIRSAVFTSAECARPARAGEGSVVVRVVVRDAMRCDFVEKVRFPVQQCVVQAGSVASLPERGRSGHRKHTFEFGELTPHCRRHLAITLQVVVLDTVQHTLEALYLLDTQLAPRLLVFGARFRRVHVDDCAFEAHVRCLSNPSL